MGETRSGHDFVAIVRRGVEAMGDTWMESRWLQRKPVETESSIGSREDGDCLILDDLYACIESAPLRPSR